MNSIRLQFMTRLRSKTSGKIALGIILSIPLGLFVLKHFREILGGGHSWKAGDWLINYRGGFVRRGLFGDLLIGIVELLNINLLWSLFILQVALYVFIFWASYKLYTKTARTKEWLIVLFSPAFLLFPYYDYLGGFRKEIIVFAAFLLLLSGYAYSRITRMTLVIAALLFAISALSHEITALTVPFFLYAIFLLHKESLISKNAAIANYLLYGSLSITSIAVAVLFYGSPETSTAICSSLESHNIHSGICIGAIKALSIQHAPDVFNQRGHFFWIYLPLLCLAISPVLISNWFKDDRQSLVIVCIGFVCIVPLFVVAYDWGRWIHILIFFTSTLMLGSSLRMTITIPTLPVSIIALYLSLWMIPTLYVSGSATNGLLWRVISGFQRLVAVTLRAVGA